jgi:hypothetical protein
METLEKNTRKRSKANGKNILNSDKKLLKSSTYVKGYHGTVVKIPEVALIGNKILVSTNNVPSKIVRTDGLMSTQQVVVGVGPFVDDIQVGDFVEIDTDKFPKSSKPGKQDVGNIITVHPPIESIEGESYLLITNNHIKFVYKTE